MNLRISFSAALLACCLPVAAMATDTGLAGIGAEVKREMASARAEVRADLAKARAELDQEDLKLGDSLSFGKRNKSGKRAADTELPPAHITRAGDLVIDGKTIAINAQQRRDLLSYRKQVISVAKAGIDGGEKAAMAALELTDTSLMALMFGAFTGSLERRVEKTVKQHIQPMVLQICHSLPELRASQQALAGSLPAFRPYATLEADDYKDCERDVRRDLAVR